jgi:hypothetical protein
MHFAINLFWVTIFGSKLRLIQAFDAIMHSSYQIGLAALFTGIQQLWIIQETPCHQKLAEIGTTFLFPMPTLLHFSH